MESFGNRTKHVNLQGKFGTQTQGKKHHKSNQMCFFYVYEQVEQHRIDEHRVSK